MKIELSIGPFSYTDEKETNKIHMEEYGKIDVNIAKQKIIEFRWDLEVDKFHAEINLNSSMHLYNVEAPGFSLYNNEDESQMIVYCYEYDNFEIELETFINDEHKAVEGCVLNRKNINEVIDLFYQQKYDEIKQLLNRVEAKKARMKIELEDRFNKTYDKKEPIDSTESNKSWQIIVMGILFVIVLFLSVKFIGT